MGAWATPSGDWGGISPSTMRNGRTRRWGIKRRVGCTAAGEPRRPHGGWGDFAPDERSGARAAKRGRRECPPAGTAKQGWVGKRGLGLSLFLPAGSRGKARWVEETQSYSLKRPKFCLDIGEHLSLHRPDAACVTAGGKTTSALTAGNSNRSACLPSPIALQCEWTLLMAKMSRVM